VTLLISNQLQNQILYLCSRIHKDEWSATLLYTIAENDLGDENCVLSAEYLYFQDIGNSVYTEYEYNADFVQFLIDNPRFLEMKIGHIHSHNNMAVFFSGTDNQELIDNSEFHNYYLSLIVNNHNEMTAKVAFRAQKKSTIESVLYFNDSSGVRKSKNTSNTVEETSIYAYPCKIILPNAIDQTLIDRFTEIIKKKLTEAKKNGSTLNLFSETPPISSNTKRMNLSAVAAKESFAREKGKQLKEPPLSKPVYSFLIKLLALDYLNESSLTNTIIALNEKLNTLSEFYSFSDQLSKRVVDFYINSFPEDMNLEQFEKVIQEASSALEKGYIKKYPELIEELVEILNFEIK
jgi:proteasome lid subunit RPN8/RPN11